MFENALSGVTIQDCDAHVANAAIVSLEFREPENMLTDVDQDCRRDRRQVAQPHYFDATVDVHEATDLTGYRFAQSFSFGESSELAGVHIAQQDMNEQQTRVILSRQVDG
jgi:hypothetical protein